MLKKTIGFLTASSKETRMPKLIKSVAIILIVLAVFLIVKKSIFFHNQKEASQLKKPADLILTALAKYKRPVRIEIETFTDKYKDEIKEIRQIKVNLDSQSKHYLIIQLFSNDADEKSPLVGQIQFKYAKTNNLLNEESLNLN